MAYDKSYGHKLGSNSVDDVSSAQVLSVNQVHHDDSAQEKVSLKRFIEK